MKKITKKILFIFLVALLGSFFCVKSMEDMHHQPSESATSIEQTCCDTAQGSSVLKILPNDFAPQMIIAWLPLYFLAGLTLLSKRFREKYFDSPSFATFPARFSKGVVQRE